MFKGALRYRKEAITEEMKLRAAHALADYISNPTEDMILPNPLDKGVAEVVALAMQ